MNQKIGVIGAGTMGAGIAQVCAQAGHQVWLCDVEQSFVNNGLDRIASSLAKAVAKGKLSSDDGERCRAAIVGSADRAVALAEVDVVIEAVPEKMELKESIFRALDIEAPKAWLLASNTSSLSLTQIAAATKNPQRVLGLHFFNPPPVMALVEIVRAAQSSDSVVERCRELVAGFGKSPISVADAPGFATSRLGLVIGLEAMRMVEQGVASPADIDTAMELGYRHAMGPLKTTDTVGLDVRLAIAEHLCHELGEVFRPPVLLRRLVRAGKLGKKSGEGFYRWSETGECLGPAKI